MWRVGSPRFCVCVFPREEQLLQFVQEGKSYYFCLSYRFMIEVEHVDGLLATFLLAGMETCQFARNRKYPKWKHALSQEWIYTLPKPEYTVVRLKDGNLSVRQGKGSNYEDMRIFGYQPSFYVMPQDIDPKSW